MYDANDLVKAVKQIGVNAFEASKPVNILFGKVISISPLQVQIDQKMILTDKQLILLRNVTNYTTSITIKNMNTNDSSLTLVGKHNHQINLNTSSSEGHNHQVNGNTGETTINEVLTHKHTIAGTFEITINNALKVNDEVILIRMQGGQKYLILDRIGD